MSAFPVGVLLFRPVTSWLMDRKSRKWTLLYGSISLAVFSGLYLVSRDLNLLLVVRLLHGSGLAAFTTASIVMISDLTTSQNRGRIMGIIGVANYMGFGLGPLLASYLYEHFTITHVFVLNSTLAALAIVFLFWIYEVPHSGKDSRRTETVIKTATQRWFLVPVLFFLIIALVHGGIVIFLPVFLREYSDLNAGIFFLVFSMSVLAVRIVAGKVADDYGRGIAIVLASFVIAASVIVIGNATTLPLLVLAAFLYGFGYGSQQPSMVALVADNTSYANRGALFSIYYGLFDLGVLLAGYLFGAIGDLFSLQTIFPVAFGIYLLGIFIFVTQTQASPRMSVKWVFSIRKEGHKCSICGEHITADPCYVCGQRGGYIRDVESNDVSK